MATHTKKPLDNLTYDIVTMLHAKSQALEAYDSYIEDAQQDPDTVRLLEDIRRHDEEDVKRLRFELGRLLGMTAQQGVVVPPADVGRAG
jgi:bacterioferritin (cytochrome b1)